MIKNKINFSSFKINPFELLRERASKKNKKPQKRGMMGFFSKLAKSFMLPIAILPIAGMLLGIGATIEGHAFGSTKAFGHILTVIGDVTFTNIPILFAVALAIGFTNYSGIAALSAVFGYLIFNAFMGGVLQPIHDPNGKVVGWNLWFWHTMQLKAVNSQLGIHTLNSGVLGGIMIGGLAAFTYNKFHKVKLPNVLGFFAGDRFVAIAMLFFSVVLSVVFCIVWPGVGWMLSKFGSWTSTLPKGLDSLIEGIGARALIPFGLHHVFYGTMWWTPAGGSLMDYQHKIVIAKAVAIASDHNISQTIIGSLKSINGNLTGQPLITEIQKILTAQHTDAFNEINKWFSAIKPETWASSGDQIMQQKIFGDPSLKIQEVWASGLHVGRFIGGGYPLFMFGLPMVAVAMWLTVPKNKRKMALGIYGSAAVTAFLTGVTEPIEFSFLFAAPWLYYVIYVPIAGISWMLMNVAGASISVSFSQGLFDYIIYGILPMFNGHNTRAWVVPLIGLGLGAVTSVIFYVLIKWKDIQIPGRTGGEIKLTTKKDFNEKKISGKGKEDVKIQTIIKGYGGKSNITSVDCCATRLRIDVKDKTKVSKDILMSTGAFGVVFAGNNVQTIFGPAVSMIKNKVENEWKK